MELQVLLTQLSDPAAYAHVVEHVEVRQTHISAVFLAGEFVYKVKKPVRFPFLDFSSLEKRRCICEREVELNRRLAPNIYLGVVPIVLQNGRLEVDGTGEPVEWAVKMRRLPDAATLEQRLNRNAVSTAQIRSLADRLAEFHKQAPFNPGMVQYARSEAVARNIRDNLDVARQPGAGALDQALLARLTDLTDEHLAAVKDLIDERANHGVPRDVHGDLHLDHVYLFPELTPPADLAIIDCIEFNDAFRFTDPVADLAFLVMDLKFHNRRDLANELATAYFQAIHDDDGMQLLPLYSSYRAAVRAKVETLELAEPEMSADEHHQAAVRARAHWLLALSELERPEQRPGLVLVGGLPGTGKSTLAHRLAEVAKFMVIRSDVVRKELAGLEPVMSSAAGFQQGIYSSEWTDRTYAECLKRSETLLRQGRRCIVDATFSRAAHRQRFIEAAERLAVPVVCLLCEADPDVIHRRLDERRGDASDADWNVYLTAAKQWEPSGPDAVRTTTVIDSGRSSDHSLEQAAGALRKAELL